MKVNAPGTSDTRSVLAYSAVTVTWSSIPTGYVSVYSSPTTMSFATMVDSCPVSVVVATTTLFASAIVYATCLSSWDKRNSCEICRVVVSLTGGEGGVGGSTTSSTGATCCTEMTGAYVTEGMAIVLYVTVPTSAPTAVTLSDV